MQYAPRTFNAPASRQRRRRWCLSLPAYRYWRGLTQRRVGTAQLECVAAGGVVGVRHMVCRTSSAPPLNPRLPYGPTHKTGRPPAGGKSDTQSFRWLFWCSQSRHWHATGGGTNAKQQPSRALVPHWAQGQGVAGTGGEYAKHRKGVGDEDQRRLGWLAAGASTYRSCASGAPATAYCRSSTARKPC